MIRTLLLIAGVSFVLAVGCLAGVAAFAGGPFWIDETGTVHRVDWRDVHHHHEHDADPVESRPDSQRQIDWPGGHKLLIDLPADVTFTQGPTSKLLVSGPQDLVSRVVVRDGEIDTDGGDFDGEHGRVKISLTAPDVSRFVLRGSERLDIAGYDQDRIDLEIAGSGAVTAHGRAKTAGLSISGSGDADLSGLALDSARVDVAGSGDATLSPKADAQITISGSGDVRLLKVPRNEAINITGSGRVDQPDGK